MLRPKTYVRPHDGHLGVRIVLEDVEVVEPVRVGIGSLSATGKGESVFLNILLEERTDRVCLRLRDEACWGIP